MPLFALIADDKPNGLAHRMAVRPEHLDYLKSIADKLVFAGPFLDENKEACGSLVVIEAADRAEADRMFAADPYAINGVFRNSVVRPWSWGVNNPTGRGQS